MDNEDDGGLMYWQQLGQHEVAEFEAWLDEVNEKLGHPVPVILEF